MDHSMNRHLIIPLSAVAAFLAVTVACSSTSKSPKSQGKALSATDEQIFLGDTVEKNYDPNVIMKRAESFFDKEEYQESIIEYQHFLDLHRIHTLAPYAQYKLGESHFKMIQTVDRDPEPMYKALEAYQKLLKEYPGSRYQGEAEERITQCNSLIAQTHLMVGQFYFRKDAYLAAASRFELVVKEYPDIDVAADALYYLALTYTEIGADDWAQEKLTILSQRFPGKYEEESKTLLARLNTTPTTESLAKSPVSSGGLSLASGGNGNGSLPKVSTQTTVNPVAALRETRKPALVPDTTLCRLGVWC